MEVFSARRRGTLEGDLGEVEECISVVCLKMKIELQLHLLMAETEFQDEDGRIISLEVPVIHKTNVNLNRESVSSFGSGKKRKMRETLPPV